MSAGMTLPIVLSALTWALGLQLVLLFGIVAWKLARDFLYAASFASGSPGEAATLLQSFLASAVAAPILLFSTVGEVLDLSLASGVDPASLELDIPETLVFLIGGSNAAYLLPKLVQTMRRISVRTPSA
ncbi:hypothetical protein NUH88_13005 [Nisaea acidiphila]|uniref:Uncharacterized protein n=1 Tax=Nisaea acidiphila TaxID=1862145 RepID=A0A9J7APQ2_9PROT|nr:hypothetical protein [Nisaea acidiphila]UUX48332.1 hypothetical protein NUH88_13005 [Nisaea acidiphila]